MKPTGARDSLEILFVGREESANEVDAALSGRLSYRRMHWVAQPDLAPSRAAMIAPDVILLDDELGHVDVISLIRQLLLMAPNAAVLVMVSMQTMSIASRAVMAGARGFVARPLDPSDLVSTIRMVLAQETTASGSEVQRRREGHIIVVCAPRGGTGRTTVAVNTAVALRQVSDEGTVLVDADYIAPAVDVMLNLQLRYTIVDLLARVPGLDEDYVDGVLLDHASGVRALLAPAPGEPFELPGVPEVQEILVYLKRMFSWIVVDLGLPLDDMAHAYLDAADRVVVNVLPEMVGLRSTRALLDHLLTRGYTDQKLWLVANRSPTQGGISKADIEKRLHIPVVYQFPDDHALMMHCINRGVPAIMSHPRSALGRALRAFAQGLVQDLGRPELVRSEGGAERGWLSRLLGRTEARASGDATAAPQPLRPVTPIDARGDAQVSEDAASLEMSDSLIVEACPYLGLEHDADARFPYPCTANFCRSESRPVPVDPPYQSQTCFGGKWTVCPRFIARLESGVEEVGEEEPPSGDGIASETCAQEGDGQGQESGNGRSPVAVIDGEPKTYGAPDAPEELTQSGSFILQSCPYLGLASDESLRYPYPDTANHCHAHDTPRPVDPVYQAETCFADDWTPCPHYRASLSGDDDELDLAPDTEATSAGDREPAEAASDAPPSEGPGHRHHHDGQPGASSDATAESRRSEADGHASEDSSGDVQTIFELLDDLAESCPYLGLYANPEKRNPFPDAANYCHARGTPVPLQISFQVSHCLGDGWPECARWKARARKDQTEEIEGKGQDELLQSDSPPTGTAEHHVPAGTTGSDTSSEPQADQATAAHDGEIPAPIEVDAHGTDGHPAEPEAHRCPFLGLRDAPEDWATTPDANNVCHAMGEPVTVSAAYQGETCLREGWEACPRYLFAPRQQTAGEDPASSPTSVAHLGPEQAAPPDAQALPDTERAEQGELQQGPADEETISARSCPFLGLRDDQETCRPYPDRANYCHAGSTPFSVMLPYQARVCLIGDWRACLRFQESLKASERRDEGEDDGLQRTEARPALPKWAVLALAGVVVILVGGLVALVGSLVG